MPSVIKVTYGHFSGFGIFIAITISCNGDVPYLMAAHVSRHVSGRGYL